jgi:hypothetical protein
MGKKEFPPGVGPHEGRELELLLAGAKPVARFRLDGLSGQYEAEFRAAVARGDIFEFDCPAEQPHLHRRYYCRRGQEWRVKLMELIEHSLADGSLTGFSEEDLHRLDGTLLGYDQTDIELFIAHVRSGRQ